MIQWSFIFINLSFQPGKAGGIRKKEVNDRSGRCQFVSQSMENTYAKLLEVVSDPPIESINDSKIKCFSLYFFFVVLSETKRLEKMSGIIVPSGNLSATRSLAKVNRASADLSRGSQANIVPHQGIVQINALNFANP
jgi:hypothetical protein